MLSSENYKELLVTGGYVKIKTYRVGQQDYMRITLPTELVNDAFKPTDRVIIGMSASGLVGIAVNRQGTKLEYRHNKVRVRGRIVKVKANPQEPPFEIVSDQACELTTGEIAQSVITFQVPSCFYRVDNMNKSQKSAIGNLTGQMLKVYNVVPLEKPWDIREIVAELARTGHNIEHRTVLGCARALAERGLVTEKPQFSFMRIYAEPTPPMTPHKPPTLEIVKVPAPEKKRGPMELLADLAAKARLFANELDNAALEIEQDFQTSEAQSKKLKQLQSLLKDIAE